MEQEKRVMWRRRRIIFMSELHSAATFLMLEVILFCFFFEAFVRVKRLPAE